MMRLSSCIIAAIAVVASMRVDAQTTWFKYEGNPVLDVGSSGQWDGADLLAGPVRREGSTYRMWYSGYIGYTGAGKIGHATSPDGVTWTEDPLNPVFSWSLYWESTVTLLPDVLPPRQDGKPYMMWYTGSMYTAFAASQDGRYSWAKNQTPVLNPGPSIWDGAASNGPCVLDTVGGFKMWYTGFRGNNLAQIGYATGTTESTWTKYATNPVLSYGAPGSWDDRQVMYPKVLQDGSLYHMWFSGGRSDEHHVQGGHATSTDGIHWTRYAANPVLKVGPSGSWDQIGAGPGGVLFDGALYHMWYTGSDGAHNRIGYAVSPKGLTSAILPSHDVGCGDTVRVVARVDSTGSFFFVARLWSQQLGKFVDTLWLQDTGADGDSLAGDGIFTHQWVAHQIPHDTRDTIYVGLALRLLSSLHDTLKFNEISQFEQFTVPVKPDHRSTFPVGYSLGQNYPNPFNPKSVISYQLPVVSRVELVVYDLLGREVSRLVDAVKQPGTYTVELDGSGLSSGVYFYRIQAGDFTQTKRLVLLK